MEPSPSRDHAAWRTAASAALPSNLRFPPEDAGHSLADMARRDLDAALQLLVDRAQYITGATGAAIALRRTGKNDMQCRASTGSNAPELGALLSTEYGLSGESVRTRQPLRCDDAERDVRVNREVCRHLGIASVVVMPVVNDEGVLGVFELFSGEVNAFGERDLSAVQRLSEMVETAVRMAEATEKLPEKLKAHDIFPPEAVADNVAVLQDVEEDKILDAPVLDPLVSKELVSADSGMEELILDEDVVLEEPNPATSAPTPASAEKAGMNATATEPLAPKIEAKAADAKISTALPLPGESVSQKPAEHIAAVSNPTVQTEPDLPKAVHEAAAAKPVGAVPEIVPAPATEPAVKVAPAPATEPAPSKKSTFWSAALNPAAEAAQPEDLDQSHVPPGLRSLRKCEACGFPVSAGRALCVECEEKKWRGQLKVPQAQSRQVASAAGSPLPRPKQEGRSLAAAAPAGLPSTPAPAVQSASSAPVSATPVVSGKELKTMDPAASMAPPPTRSVAPQAPAVTLESGTEKASPEFVLSAGFGPSQSWFSANKYILIALLLVAVVVATFLILR